MAAPQSYPVCTNPECDLREEDQARQQAQTSGEAASCSDGDEVHPKCEMAEKCVEACAAYGRVCPCSARAAGRAACTAVKKLRENSNVFAASSDGEGTESNNSNNNNMTKLNADDLVIGEKLGEGGFSVVNACTLKTDPEKKIAVKYLKRKVMVNQRHFEHGAADLAQEAHFLSVLDHPHIIKLHGVTAGSVQTNVATGKECGFFITVDRLYDTLESRLEHWRAEHEKSHQPGGGRLFARMTAEHKEKKKQELRERIQIALEIAEAVEYLHDKEIIFRDLKPDNIGFDASGCLKLFDFGLAKELKPGEGNADGRYELTGNTGSRRYMAPEVAKELPYNKSVDAYSFGILLHELLSGEKPFFGYSSGKHMSLVVMGGERPKMDSKHTSGWPMNLQWLMKRCWSPFPTSRPDFHVIRQTLHDFLDGKDSGLPNVSNSQKQSTSATTEGATRRCTTPPKQILEPPVGGFSSLLRPKRTKGKSQGSASSADPSRSPVKSPAGRHGKRGISFGWVFGR